ncbi:MAG: MGMT family protein [Candidatus Dojkabacteria bacterium]|nr:MGMT family protein [Candidatus Dojkabacteria bacterium]MDQ7021361.1 MGMT family protein [Candidatus Dojkabacteria bacterium]
MQNKELSFKEKVIDVVKSIPRGKVLNYGSVAAISGSPRASRQVGSILTGISGENREVPWWRVVNKAGYLSIRGKLYDAKELQMKLLIDEGVEVSKDYYIDMRKYKMNVNFS